MSNQVEEKDGNTADEQAPDDQSQSESEEQEDEIVEISRSELEALKEERDEFEQKFMRKTADLDNLRKRKEKEKDELRKFAHTDLLSDLLEVIDNFDRALDSLELESEDVRDGVLMIQNQLHELLEKYDVEPIEAEGEPFDPHKHEGMMREEKEELDRQVVLEVFQEGYQLHDRVLRPASVKVGVPASSGQEDEGSE